MTAACRLAGLILLVLTIPACTTRNNQKQFKNELESIRLSRGDITLCGSGKFGTVAFGLSCSEKVRDHFNLATALLHSFEYTEAEKVFAKVIDDDPDCIMAYWGAAMCNFHPLWAAPNEADLQKGSRIIALARSVESKSTRETEYLETIATIYDHWKELDHRTRTLKFETASEALYKKYPNDAEAAIFYALALRATAIPTDKSFHNQKVAGEILERIFASQPDHPGIAHYIIHTYDYPELAELALPAARKYASIAAASAHAQHMPSHIFTRLGLWDEAIQSNLNSIAAAQCYAQATGIKGHWDEELHGMDYLIYAYLQEAKDEKAKEQIDYLSSIHDVFPLNFKDAYSFGAMPARFALERKDWTAAARLDPEPTGFPWEKFQWEKANVYFARLLGAVHTHDLAAAKKELTQLQVVQDKLNEANQAYKANLVLIQIKASEGWIKFAEGNRADGITLMRRAADMEDSTEKDPVTPGEIIPARELLADMYSDAGDAAKALEAYEADLKRHPKRFNGLYGAGLAASQSGDTEKAAQYYNQLLAIAHSSGSRRPQQKQAELFIRNHR